MNYGIYIIENYKRLTKIRVQLNHSLFPKINRSETFRAHTHVWNSLFGTVMTLTDIKIRLDTPNSSLWRDLRLDLTRFLSLWLDLMLDLTILVSSWLDLRLGFTNILNFWLDLRLDLIKFVSSWFDLRLDLTRFVSLWLDLNKYVSPCLDLRLDLTNVFAAKHFILTGLSLNHFNFCNHLTHPPTFCASFHHHLPTFWQLHLFLQMNILPPNFYTFTFT